LEKFDLEYINLEALMFQTGYLTIKDMYIDEDGEEMYMLDYPNKEVRKSFNSDILFYITGEYQKDITTIIQKALKNQDLNEFKKQLEIFFDSISYNILTNENVYQAAIYGLIYATGYHITIEDNTSKGRIDLTVIVNKKIVYILEFKVIQNQQEKGKALTQIKQKEYFKKYLNYDKIYIVGIEFNKKDKKILNFEYEILK
ncbi:MAG: PD-(D/E)XK nuclease domain-containing protein, partial [bacterium]